MLVNRRAYVFKYFLGCFRHDGVKHISDVIETVEKIPDDIFCLFFIGFYEFKRLVVGNVSIQESQKFPYRIRTGVDTKSIHMIKIFRKDGVVDHIGNTETFGESLA